MARDYRLYLDDIIEAVRRIKEFTNNMGFDDFRADIKTQDAVVRNLEIIGEASRSISEDLKLQFPEIEWREIVDLRNLLLHEYFGVDLNIVWSIIQIDLPPFKSKIQNILLKLR